MAEAVYAGGVPLRLASKLAAGGEGAVYALDEPPGYCVKIYHAATRTPARLAKLEAMLVRVPVDPAGAGHCSIAWPKALVRAGPERGAPVAGFIMPRAPAGARSALAFLQPEDRARLHPGFDFRYLLTAGRNLAMAIAALHQAGYCIGDINETNVLVAPTALVTLIDCDSFQVPIGPGRVLHCSVARPEYTAPELAGQALDAVARTPASDAFGLAVLLFQFLMQGFHPFSGRWRLAGEPPGITARMAAGLYAYGGRTEIEPPGAAPRTAVLPAGVRDAFARAFGPGVTDPARRPTAAQWVALLDQGVLDLRSCPAQRGHVYPRRLRSCPWCALARQGFDYFPDHLGAQTPLPAPGAAAAGSRPATAPPAQPPPQMPPGPRPAAGGRPRLILDRERVTFDALVRGGQARTETVVLRNIGKGVFHGRATVDPPCTDLSVTPSTIDLSPYHGENELTLTLRADPGDLAWGQRYTRAVRIEGSGAASVAHVAITVQESRDAIRQAIRWSRWGAWAAPVVAAELSNNLARLPLVAIGGTVTWLWEAVLNPSHAPGLAATGLWIAATAWCAVRWRLLAQERPRSPAPALLCLAVALLPLLAALCCRAYAVHPTLAFLPWAIAAVLVPASALAGPAFAWLIRRPMGAMLTRRGSGLASLVLVAVIVACGAPLATVAVIGLARAGTALHAGAFADAPAVPGLVAPPAVPP